MVVTTGNHIATVEILASDSGTWSEWDVPTSSKFTYTITVNDEIPEPDGACYIIIPLLVPLFVISIYNKKYKM